MADRRSLCRLTWHASMPVCHRYIATSGRDADAAVPPVATEVLADTQESWPVDSGASRAAWWGPNRLAPASYQIGNPVVYAKVLEYGGYTGVGPKTEQHGGTQLAGVGAVAPGIFSTQAHAPLRRALSKNYRALGKILKALETNSGDGRMTLLAPSRLVNIEKSLNSYLFDLNS